MRFGVVVVYGFVKFNVFLPNRTQEINKTVHPVSYRRNFHSLLETLDYKNIRLLQNGRVNKADISSI